MNDDQKHKEDLEAAKGWLAIAKENNNTLVIQILEKFFPELKESEDEKIRKSIIDLVEKQMPKSENKKWMIAWLEKQREQKPDTNCLLSWSEIEEKMLQSLEGIVKDYWAKAEQEKNEIKIREASNVSYFLKTIQKSPLCWIKCSDGLPNKDGTYLVVTDGRHNDVYDMARYDSIEGWHKASEIIYWMPIPQLNNKSIIEQKPAWSEEDEKKIMWIVRLISTAGFRELDNDKMPCTRTELIDWLKSIKVRNILQSEQELSDEYSSMIDDIISLIQDAPGCLESDKKKMINWVKSNNFIPIEQDTEVNDLWVYIREWNDKFGRLPKDEDELASCIDYVMKRQKRWYRLSWSKFKVCDWITNGEYTWKVIVIHPLDYILQSPNGDIMVDDTISYVDEHFHVWTIQDAKDGDVLVTDSGMPFIFKGCLDERHPNSPVSYCGIDSINYFYGYNGNRWWTDENVYPATKEQRELLFQKMKEAGYEWDAEKKELRKIELKPNWSEEDEKNISIYN